LWSVPGIKMLKTLKEGHAVAAVVRCLLLRAFWFIEGPMTSNDRAQ
jgi:hypothetical protein